MAYLLSSYPKKKKPMAATNGLSLLGLARPEGFEPKYM
jgi:hypothetical protein